jgi:type IV pilus assembly protein PilA
MFLQNLRAKVGARLNGDREAGFTLIELLVVMLILGILAAIAIPAFFNQREKASDAQAKSAARTAETAMETYATENAGSYENATATKLHEIEPTLQTAGDNRIEVSGLGKETFTVTSVASSGTGFSISRAAGGTVTFDCTAKANGKGGCPKGGDWSK